MLCCAYVIVNITPGWPAADVLHRLAALVRVWNVFPFALGDWAILARAGLGVAMPGTLIAMILQITGLMASRLDALVLGYRDDNHWALG